MASLDHFFYCCAKRLQAGGPLGQLRHTPFQLLIFPHLHAQLPTPELIRTDLCQGIVHGLRQQVDLLLFNPPYVPTPDEEMGLGDVLAAAWAGGWKGRRVVDRFLPLVPQLLSPQGQLFLIAVRENEPEGARHGPVLGCALSEEGLRGGGQACMHAEEDWPVARPETAATRRLPDFLSFVDIMQRLRDLGLMAAIELERTADEERLLVIRAWSG